MNITTRLGIGALAALTGLVLFALLAPAYRAVAPGPDNPPVTSGTPPRGAAAKSCIRGGCSGELCVDASQESIATTCEYRPEYACYKDAVCEVQQDGECGWTETPELLACIANPPPIE